MPGAAEVSIKSDGAARELLWRRRRRIEFCQKAKDVRGAIFTTFEESEGARTARSTNDFAEASYITFMMPIFNLHICISPPALPY